MARNDDSRRRTRVPRLLERVIQQRRRQEAGEESTEPDAAGADGSDDRVAERLASLERRLDRLESLVEGLQDSVHRESVRHQREIDDVRRGRVS